MGCGVASGALAIGLFILKVPALLLLELKLALLLVPLVLFHLGTLLVELVLHILQAPLDVCGFDNGKTLAEIALGLLVARFCFASGIGPNGDGVGTALERGFVHRTGTQWEEDQPITEPKHSGIVDRFIGDILRPVDRLDSDQGEAVAALEEMTDGSAGIRQDLYGGFLSKEQVAIGSSPGGVHFLRSWRETLSLQLALVWFGAPIQRGLGGALSDEDEATGKDCGEERFHRLAIAWNRRRAQLISTCGGRSLRPSNNASPLRNYVGKTLIDSIGCDTIKEFPK